MLDLARYLPFRGSAPYRREDLPRDVTAGLGVGFLAVPQAIAYAMIAGLPPVAGLYAAAVPAIVGSLFRSSRHVITGPSNALSLLVGTAIVTADADDPVQAALTLALMVGAFQVAAGLLRLGILVDYISRPVVLGYITGAGVLILLGQLPNVTATGDSEGLVIPRMVHWASTLAHTHWAAVALSLSTAALIVALRKLDPRIPGAIVAMAAGIVLAYAVDLPAWGIPTVADLTPVPAGLPPFTLPDVSLAPGLVSAAVAVTVLSLVESTSVARNIAEETGQTIHRSVEMTGQGLANVSAAFFGGYPTSGSLARSALARQLGSRTRLAGLLSGVVVLLVLLFLGPVVDHTPVPTLAGLLLVIAVDLVEVKAIRRVMRSHAVDKLAFVGTLVGTFLLPLDEAIYLGVGISLVMFLRRARMLVVQEMVVDSEGRLDEVDPESDRAALQRCPCIRIVHVEGSLFFGAAGELRSALEQAIEPEEVRVLVVRIKRAHDLDVTSAQVIQLIAQRLAERGGRMLLVGMRARDTKLLERTGIADAVGRENLYPTEPGIFVAMRHALARARQLAGDHACGADCPVSHVKPPRGAGGEPPPGPR